VTSNRAVPFSFPFPRHMSHCIATVGICITSFETCGHDLIAAFGASHLLANYGSSVACFIYRAGTYVDEFLGTSNDPLHAQKEGGDFRSRLSAESSFSRIIVQQNHRSAESSAIVSGGIELSTESSSVLSLLNYFFCDTG
jgi:hypothetical protein